MEEIDKLEHFTISRRRDGSLWELGRGAMGVTYKALDTNLQSEVALKVISAQYLGSEPARQRFLREARAAASLRHPNVATVFHLGKVDGLIYYAMEYVNGETVERRVQREGPMHPLLALRIVRQVTGALVAADREKLVHRDIKPSNIMLALEQGDDQLLVKVIDFGLAKSFISSARQSGTLTVGGFVGTPHFASPEQLEEKEVDVRSDIYSLGATLWYMLTGHPPFEGALARVIYQHIGEPLPSSVLQRFSPGLRNLLEKLLAKKLEERFQTPLELKAEVDALLNELGDNPIAVSPTEPSRVKEGTSVSGIAIGQLIRNRYLIVNPSPFEPHTFKAEDLQSDAKAGVALRFLPLACTNDPRQLAGRAAQTQELSIEAKETRTLHFGLTRAVDAPTASPSPTPAATSSDGLPALLTAPGLKPEAEGSAPSASQPGSAPTVRPPLQSESATERTGQNRSLPRQPRVFQPVPNQLRQQPRPAQSPIFLTRKNYSQARREALRQFDAQWNAKRDDLKRQRDWLSYQINHSTGTAQEKFKVQMEQVKGQIDQFDGQRRSARKVLRQSWEGPRTG